MVTKSSCTTQLLYGTAVVYIVSRRGRSNDARRANQPKERNLALYVPSVQFNNSITWLYVSSETESFSYKAGFGVASIEAFKRRASFGYI